jgi:hypothetical protein
LQASLLLSQRVAAPALACVSPYASASYQTQLLLLQYHLAPDLLLLLCCCLLLRTPLLLLTLAACLLLLLLLLLLPLPVWRHHPSAQLSVTAVNPAADGNVHSGTTSHTDSTCCTCTAKKLPAVSSPAW